MDTVTLRPMLLLLALWHRTKQSHCGHIEITIFSENVLKVDCQQQFRTEYVLRSSLFHICWAGVAMLGTTTMIFIAAMSRVRCVRYDFIPVFALIRRAAIVGTTKWMTGRV